MHCFPTMMLVMSQFSSWRVKSKVICISMDMKELERDRFGALRDKQEHDYKSNQVEREVC